MGYYCCHRIGKNDKDIEQKPLFPGHLPFKLRKNGLVTDEENYILKQESIFLPKVTCKQIKDAFSYEIFAMKQNKGLPYLPDKKMDKSLELGETHQKHSSYKIPLKDYRAQLVDMGIISKTS